MNASDERPDDSATPADQNPGDNLEADHVSELLARIAALTEENERLKTRLNQEEDRVLRTAAEFDNFRKRAARDRDDARRSGAANVIEDLLPVMDNLGYGLDAATRIPEAKPILDGMNFILTQLNNALAQNGLRELNPVGEPFNAQLHESVGREAHPTLAEDRIVAVRRKGFLLNEKLLRPAAVVLSAGPDSTSPAT